MAAITANALDKCTDVEASYIVQTKHKFQSLDGKFIFLPKYPSKKRPIAWLVHKLKYRRNIKKLIETADVLHYFWSPAFDDGIDLSWASKIKKPIFIEWLGSDIRDSSKLRKLNPYYERALDNGYEYADLEHPSHSLKNQQLFSKYGAIPLLCPEMMIYLEKDLFPRHHLVFQRINTKEFQPKYPSSGNKRPLIVHSPSAPIAKGTNFVTDVVTKLKKDYDFDFRLINNLSREEALKIVSKSDIFIDQFIIGGYGMAAMEAMSYGKPVMCYIMQEVYENGLPRDCPIVNTNPDNLESKLTGLLENPYLRNEVGIKSRQYVEQYHDADKIGKQLLEIYFKAANKSLNAAYTS